MLSHLEHRRGAECRVYGSSMRIGVDVGVYAGSPEACVGRGEGRGWSAREGRCGIGQEVVTSWRTVEKAIMRSQSPRHAQRAGA